MQFLKKSEKIIPKYYKNEKKKTYGNGIL